jgi:hypothetical protein
MMTGYPYPYPKKYVKSFIKYFIGKKKQKTPMETVVVVESENRKTPNKKKEKVLNVRDIIQNPHRCCNKKSEAFEEWLKMVKESENY